MKLCILGLLGVLAMLEVGCGDEQAPKQHAEQGHSGFSHAERKANWLDAFSEVEPATWLIERESTMGRNLSAEDANNLRQSLAAVSKLFREDPRMIANRAVQIETMLDPTDGRESAVWLLTELAHVVTEPGRVEGFGALGQQYYNMRKAGFSEQDALQDLSRRYGSRG